MKNVFKNTGILLAITLVAAIALSFVYELTKEPIALAAQKEKAEAYGKVYETAATFEDVNGFNVDDYNASLPTGTAVEEVLRTVDAGGNHLGYVTTVTAKGYGGAVRIALGIDKNGTVVGYAVLEHEESPGFGANCENEDVRQQFLGITSADQIDGITGATITTNALKSETQAAIDLVKQLEGGEGI